MTHIRLTTARLRQLAAELSPRYTAPLAHLAAARVLTGAQLDRLLADLDTSADTTSRVRRRIMTRLAALGVVGTLERRIGGVRAGSAGHVHVLTPAGHRLVALLDGQPTPRRARHSRAPGPMFVNHALDIAEVYIQLTETSRTGTFGVAAFLTEPATWWPTGNGAHLRPDAYTLLRATTHADCWWLEIDRDTESPARLRDKIGTYRDFLTTGGTGPHGVSPRVLFTAPTQQRADTIRAAIAAVMVADAAMITVTTHAHGAQFLGNELHAV